MKFWLIFALFLAKIFANDFFVPTFSARINSNYQVQNEIGGFVDLGLKGKFFTNFSYKTNFFASLPIQKSQNTMFCKDKNSKAVFCTGLRELALIFDSQNFFAKIYRHSIDTPLLSYKRTNAFKMAVEGLSFGFKNDKSKLDLGVYSRVFGVHKLGQKTSFESFSDSIYFQKNISQNYLTMLGYKLDDKNLKLQMYYYKLLDNWALNNGVEQKNSIDMFYFDSDFFHKTQDLDIFGLSFQLSVFSDTFKNNSSIFGINTSYKPNFLPILLSFSSNLFTKTKNGIDYPLNQSPFYTDNDYNFFAYKGSAYKLSLKHYAKFLHSQIYTKFTNASDLKAKELAYGLNLSSKNLQDLEFGLWLEGTQKSLKTSKESLSLNTFLEYSF